MQFITAAIAAAILGFTSAAPAPAPIGGYPTGANIIAPTTTSQYEVWTGAVHFKAPTGKIFKDGHTTDITTLLTFDFPAASQGKTCEFHFFLPSDATSVLAGTGAFDVFTSLAPATQDTTTWPSGNLRDQHAGRVQAYANGEGYFLDGFPKAGASFPCPYGQKLAGELVGTGDVDHIEWASSGAGPYIKFY